MKASRFTTPRLQLEAAADLVIDQGKFRKRRRRLLAITKRSRKINRRR